MAGIFWLASYPKSGNTWMRMFLSNLTGERDKPVDINSPHGNEIASSRAWLDHLLAFDSCNLTAEEIDSMRPACHAWASREAREIAFHKIHDANVIGPANEPLIAPGSCPGALYILRNPLDVASSAANHWGESVDAAIERMNSPHGQLVGRTRSGPQVRQRMLDWSSHVRSWVDAQGLPVHVVRYEELLAQPLDRFGAVARFLGLPADEASLTRAIEASRFEELASQEAKTGFRERPRKSAKFFRSGRAGGWREELSAAQVERIVQAHRGVMHRFGYLDADGQPL